MKAKKVNLYKWTGNDDLRPLLNGVYHDAEKAVAVATDAYAIIVSKSDYIKPLENAKLTLDKRGYVVNKKGDYLAGKFPKWEVVFGGRICEDMDIDRETVSRKFERAKAHNKEHRKSIDQIHEIAVAEDVYLSILGCKRLLSLPEDVKFKAMRPKYDDGFAMIYGENDNYKVLFMPTSGTSATRI